MRGGKNKSDPCDAATMAIRPDLRAVGADREIDVDIRLLVGRRREIVTDQTHRSGRLRDLLSSLFSALERRIDAKTKTGLIFLSPYAGPHELRAARSKRAAYLRGVPQMTEKAIARARAQSPDVSGVQTRARLVKELSPDALVVRETRGKIDRDIADLLMDHPDAPHPQPAGDGGRYDGRSHAGLATIRKILGDPARDQRRQSTQKRLLSVRVRGSCAAREQSILRPKTRPRGKDTPRPSSHSHADLSTPCEPCSKTDSPSSKTSNVVPPGVNRHLSGEKPGLCRARPSPGARSGIGKLVAHRGKLA